MSSSYAPLERMTREQILALGSINPEFKDWLAKNDAPTLPNPANPQAGRDVVREQIPLLRERMGPPEESLEESAIKISVRDGWQSNAFVLRPSLSAKKEPGPLIVIYHGGGFIAGFPESQIPNARTLVRLFNAVVVLPAYRLAPEDKFPTGVNDAYDTLQWAAQNAASLRADPRKGFIVGGSSAGANFAGVLARRAVEERLEPRITGQWLSYPLLFDQSGGLVPEKYRELFTSWEQNKDAILLPHPFVDALLAHYGADYSSPLYNPLSQSSPFDLGKMPRAFVQVGGTDVLRDDGIVYAYMLEDHGVEVQLEAYPGVPHVFAAFAPGLEISNKAMTDVCVGMGWLLGKEVVKEEAMKALLGK